MMQLNKKAAEEKHSEIKRMTDFNRVSYFTSFHKEKEAYFEP